MLAVHSDETRDPELVSMDSGKTELNMSVHGFRVMKHKETVSVETSNQDINITYSFSSN